MTIAELPGLPEPLTHETPEDDDYHRRFGGVARLYGAAGMARLEAASVCVIGIGGVGSWAAEALARNAVGRITLIDLDHIAPSNTNRQIHALGDAYGRAKVEAMGGAHRGHQPALPRLADRRFRDRRQRSPTAERLRLRDRRHRRREDQDRHPRLDAGSGAARASSPAAGRAGSSIPRACGSRIFPGRCRTRCWPRCAATCAASSASRAIRSGSSTSWRSIRTNRCATRNPSSRPARSTRLRPRRARRLQGLACAGYGSSVAVTAVFGFVAASAVIAAIVAGNDARSTEDATDED